jgi:hypothetical protein
MAKRQTTEAAAPTELRSAAWSPSMMTKITRAFLLVKSVLHFAVSLSPIEIVCRRPAVNPPLSLVLPIQLRSHSLKLTQVDWVVAPHGRR